MTPALFVSHGSPTMALTDTPARRFLSKLSAEFAAPKAILAISAHWMTLRPAVNSVARNETIHDFGGFPAELYRIQYPAPGSPQLAQRAVELLAQAEIACGVDPQRGLDHGAWAPMRIMYPQADIPVVQLSVQPRSGPAHHFKMGRALAPLREEGVLIFGSGSFTHNLYEVYGDDFVSQAPPWVNAFADWMQEALEKGRRADLLNYRSRAPHAAKNHPTEEHLSPLFVAMGAGAENGRVRQRHASVSYGVLRMDVYEFE